jgi:alkaline phosphatase
VVAERSSGHKGSEVLQAASRQARQENLRLFGFFGVHGQGKYSSANLPLATADGQYDPVAGVDGHSVEYTAADLAENPTLAEMTTAALAVLGANDTPFWLMVEPGDVDWSNHNNNLDDSIGAVNTGDHAVRVITAWVETHSNWNESLLIVTADHGHLLVIDDPEALARISGAGKTATND